MALNSLSTRLSIQPKNSDPLFRRAFGRRHESRVQSRRCPGLVVRVAADLAAGGVRRDGVGLSALRHVVAAEQFDTDMLSELFNVADEMKTIRPGTEGSKQLQGM
eukprot:scaffold84290_cov41-Prasinocladus_malaysianus.AAC.1